MFFIKLSADEFLFASGNDDPQPMIINKAKAGFLREAPFFEWPDSAVLKEALKNAKLQPIESDTEVLALYQKFEKADEEERQFQQEMADLDWEMWKAFHQ